MFSQKPEMLDCLANVLAKSLAEALEGPSDERRILVRYMVAVTAQEFLDALAEGQKDEAAAPTKAGFAILVAAVELESQD